MQPGRHAGTSALHKPEGAQLLFTTSAIAFGSLQDTQLGGVLALP